MRKELNAPTQFVEDALTPAKRSLEQPVVPSAKKMNTASGPQFELLLQQQAHMQKAMLDQQMKFAEMMAKMMKN